MIILHKQIAGATHRSLDRFLARAQRAIGLRGTVTVLVTTNRRLRTLNARFRRKDRPTDVLSFPAAPLAGDDHFAGDIAISADIAAQNARRLGHPVAEEIKILALHGLLHLAGYDHESDDGEMARTESLLRRKLGLPVALIERSRPINKTMSPKKDLRKSRALPAPTRKRTP